MKYPCKECLLKTICSELCEELKKDDVNARILEFIRKYKCCPDCGGTRLVGCGGEPLSDYSYKVFVNSSALCIECGSLFFEHHGFIGRFRKHREVISTKVWTFWEYLYKHQFISEKEYNDG